MFLSFYKIGQLFQQSQINTREMFIWLTLISINVSDIEAYVLFSHCFITLLRVKMYLCGRNKKNKKQWKK